MDQRAQAGDLTRPGGAELRERVRVALTVLLTALSGGPLASASGLPGGEDDLVADAIDNLGFGGDDTVPAQDLAFVNLARVREAMNEAEDAELERAWQLVRTVMAYAQTLAFLGSRTDRSLRRPAYNIVYSRVIGTAGPLLPLCLPFAVAARRQYGPRWDDHIAGLACRPRRPQACSEHCRGNCTGSSGPMARPSGTARDS